MLEPQVISEYSSERAFNFHETSWSSAAFVLRSFGGMFLGDAIDLVFLSTDHVDVPFEIIGHRISQPCDKDAANYEQAFGVARKLEEPAGRRVFLIESGGQQFHVIACKMWVLVRPHDPKLSLRPMLDSNSVEREDFISKHVKEWYKMSALVD